MYLRISIDSNPNQSSSFVESPLSVVPSSTPDGNVPIDSYISSTDNSGSSNDHDLNPTTDHPPDCGPTTLGVIGIGITGRVELLRSRDKVKKSPHPSASDYDKRWMRKHIDREVVIYQRLPKMHDRLIRMLGYSTDDADYNIVLEYLPNRDLKEFVGLHSSSPHQRLRWALDAAEAIKIVHGYGIIHGDIKPSNFLVDGHLRLRLIDFSGSSIDDQPALVVENARFFLPRSRKDDSSSVLTDLFALGSTIYEMMTIKQPYEELDDEVIEAKYARGEFPAVDDVACGKVIRGCCTMRFDTAKAVHECLQAEVKRLAGEDPNMPCINQARIILILS